jgi:hypothetical protein
MIGSSEEGFGSQANQSHRSNGKGEILIDCEMRKDLLGYRLRKMLLWYRCFLDMSPIIADSCCQSVGEFWVMHRESAQGYRKPRRPVVNSMLECERKKPTGIDILKVDSLP